MAKHLAIREIGIQAGNITTVNRVLVQLAVYELMLGQRASALGETPFRAREVVLFVTRIPNLVPADPALRASFYFAHQFGICLLAILVACQAVAALLLHFIFNDRAMQDKPPAVNGMSGTSPSVPVAKIDNFRPQTAMTRDPFAHGTRIGPAQNGLTPQQDT